MRYACPVPASAFGYAASVQDRGHILSHSATTSRRTPGALLALRVPNFSGKAFLLGLGVAGGEHDEVAAAVPAKSSDGRKKSRRIEVVWLAAAHLVEIAPPPSGATALWQLLMRPAGTTTDKEWEFSI